MKTKTFNSLGLNVNIAVPETVEEFDQNAKRAGACLESAINNTAYRVHLAEFRDLMIHGQEEVKDEKTGAVLQPEIRGLIDNYDFPRLERDSGRKNEKNEPIMEWGETEAKYVARLLAAKGLKTEDLQSLADSIASHIKFDASAAERKPAAPKKLAEQFLNGGKALLANEKKFEEFSKRYHKMFGAELPYKAVAADVENAEAKNAEALGWLIKAFIVENEKRSLATITG